MDLLFGLFKKYRELIFYCIIGFSGVFLDFLVFKLLTEHTPLHYQFANIISVSVGITNNFLLNAYFNFKKTDKFFLRFISFYAIGIVGMLLSALGLYIFIELLHYDVVITKAILIVIVALIQFVLNKFITFS